MGANIHWECGQHPAMTSGWIVKPVLMGANVRVLHECEGGHVVLLNEHDAKLIAAAPDLLHACKMVLKYPNELDELQEVSVRYAIAKATT